MQHCIADAAQHGEISGDEALRQFKALAKYL
jgi:hypothetical protein